MEEMTFSSETATLVARQLTLSLYILGYGFFACLWQKGGKKVKSGFRHLPNQFGSPSLRMECSKKGVGEERRSLRVGSRLYPILL